MRIWNGGSLENIKLLLSTYPDSIHQEDGHGHLPLHLALLTEASEEIIVTLLETCPGTAGVKEDAKGKLPLHHALHLSNVANSLAQLYPESLTMHNNDGDLPLRSFCRSSSVSFGAAKFLVEAHPTSVHVKGMDQRYPLHCATFDNPYDKREIIECLIEQNPSAASAAGAPGALPTHMAPVEAASREVLQLLLHHHKGNHNGLDIVDNRGRAPLHWSSRLPMGAFELALGRRPAAISVADNGGALPLHEAAAVRANSARAHLLLEANPISVLQTTQEGLTPLQVVCSHERCPAEARDLLTRKQGEAVHHMRGTIQSKGEEIGLPDLALSTACLFVLPKTLSPIEEELTWQAGGQQRSKRVDNGESRRAPRPVHVCTHV